LNKTQLVALVAKSILLICTRHIINTSIGQGLSATVQSASIRGGLPLGWRSRGQYITNGLLYFTYIGPL